MDKVRVIVVGVGHLGKEHARIYSQMPDVDLIAIVDKDEKMLQRIAKKINVPAYTNLEDVKESFDAASVVVPTIDHFGVAKQLMERNINLLIEKPFAQNLQQAHELMDLACEKNVLVTVGHIERFNPAFIQIEKNLKHPRFIEVHRLGPFPDRATDVGVVLDLMIHDIDIILQIVDSPIVDIRAVGVPIVTSYEDIVNARLEFENKCVANITASRVSLEPMRKMRFFQEDLYISLDYHKQKGKMISLEGKKIIPKKIPIIKEEPLWVELSDFIHCLRTKKEPKVSILHGINALDAALKITDLCREHTNDILQSKLNPNYTIENGSRNNIL